MKTRLNLTIEDNLLQQAKAYAQKHQTSISKLVEESLNNLIKPRTNKKNLIDLVKSLPKVELPYDNDVDLKKQYYEERASKYGF